MTTILNGLLGGLLIGLLATVVTRLISDEPSEGAVLLERVGGSSGSGRWAAGLVLVLYGTLAGGVLVALELNVLRLIAVPPTAVEAFGLTVAWSALLFGVVVALWRVGSSRSLIRSRFGELLTYHVVLGIGLGLWIRFTWIT